MIIWRIDEGPQPFINISFESLLHDTTAVKLGIHLSITRQAIPHRLKPPPMRFQALPISNLLGVIFRAEKSGTEILPREQSLRYFKGPSWNIVRYVITVSTLDDGDKKVKKREGRQLTYNDNS